MSEEDKKLVKVSFEYLLSDGKRQIRFLEGEELKSGKIGLSKFVFLRKFTATIRIGAA